MNIEDFDYNTLKGFCGKSFEPIIHPPIELRLDKLVPANLKLRWVPYYHFKIYKGDTEAGHVNFRVGNTADIIETDGHIGYHINTHYRGQNFAYMACSLLFPFIKDHGFNTIVLTCNPHNYASQNTIKKLGGKLIKTQLFSEPLPDGDIERNIYHVSLSTAKTLAGEAS